jgi:gluconokinase
VKSLPLVILIMGVAGSGKTTVGLKLARSLGWKFHDADEFHPPANIAKMSAGIPLNDRDRVPWLAAMRACIDACLDRGESSVVACSALREKYRKVLMAGDRRVKGVCLKGDFALILRRISRRRGHFMKENMLASQFEELEPPKNALTLDVAQRPAKLVAEIRRAFSL